VKQGFKNVKIIHMSKITQYFYIFSKLTTSVVLVFIVFIMGYVLLKSYKSIDNSKNDLEFNFKSLSNTVTKNNNDYLNLEKRINNTEIKINEFIKMLESKNILSVNNQYKEDIKNLLNLNNELQEQVNQIVINLNYIKGEKNPPLKKEQNNQIESTINLILIKYKNGESVKSELNYLEALLKNESNNFEKLFTIEFKKYYGLNNLYNEFNLSSKEYVTTKFINESKNSLLSFLFKFISIKPNDLEIYNNNELNILAQAKKFIELENIEGALIKILIIDKEKKFFIRWIEQSEIYLEFTNELDKVN